MCIASHVAPTGDLACNPGMCPDWELNQRLFGSQPALNPLSLYQPGLLLSCFKVVIPILKTMWLYTLNLK